MKKLILISSVLILASVVLYSCTKKGNEVMTEQQAVDNLTGSESFISFSKAFIPDFAAIMQYHRTVSVLNNKKGFLSQVQLAGNDENKLAAAYSNFSLQYDHAILLKNKIDNDVLRLLNSHGFLRDFDEKQTERILIAAMDAGVHSDDPKWVQAKAGINDALKISNLLNAATKSMNTVGTNYAPVIPPVGLNLDEIWDCAKSAAGFGSAGIIGIAAIKELAKQGIQAAVITVSKWLAAKAGWFGVAITLIDFGSCIYKEAID